MNKLFSLLLAMVSMCICSCSDDEDTYQAATWPAEVQDAVLLEIKAQNVECRLLCYTSRYEYLDRSGAVIHYPDGSEQGYYQKDKQTYYAVLMVPNTCTVGSAFRESEQTYGDIDFAYNVAYTSGKVGYLDNLQNVIRSIWSVEWKRSYKRVANGCYYYLTQYKLEAYTLVLVTIVPMDAEADGVEPYVDDLWEYANSGSFDFDD